MSLLKKDFQKQNRMTKIKKSSLKLIILLVALSLVIFIITIIFKSDNILDKKEIPVFLEVGDNSGIALGNTSQINFGRIPYGSAAQRTVSLENYYDFSIEAFIEVSGNVSQFLIYEPYLEFNPREKKEFGIGTIIFSNESYGNYSGKMSLIFKRLKS